MSFCSRVVCSKLQCVNKANIKGGWGNTIVAQGVSTEAEALSKTSLQNFNLKKDHPTDQHLGEKNLLAFRSVINIKKDNQATDFSLQKCHFLFSSVITFL